VVSGRRCGLICVKYWIGWSYALRDGRFHCKILWNKDLGRRCFVARGARSDPGGGATAGSLRGWISRTLSHCGFFGILSKGCSSQGLRFLLWKAVEISQLSLGHFCGLPSSISSAERCGSPDDVDLQAVDWDELPTGAVHFANSRRSGATQDTATN